MKESQTTLDLFGDEIEKNLDELINLDETIDLNLDSLEELTGDVNIINTEYTQSLDDITIHTQSLEEVESIEIDNEAIDTLDNIENEMTKLNEKVNTIANTTDLNEIDLEIDRISDNVENRHVKDEQKPVQDSSNGDQVKELNENAKEEVEETNQQINEEVTQSKKDEETIIIDSDTSNLNEVKITNATTELNHVFEELNIMENHNEEEINVKVEEVKYISEGEYGKVNIMVIGVGGCGCNAVNRMYEEKVDEIKLVTIDTSEQTLENVSSDYKVLIGEDLFRGHGSGGDIDKTEKAFDNSKNEIQNILQNIDMLFITGGIGRGTGSVGLYKIGKIAKEMGILTIGFATLPRKIETNYEILNTYYEKFLTSVDSSVIIENERVSKAAQNLPILEAMKVADSMLVDGIRGTFELITKPGKINLDYADIKTAFTNQGSSIMGIGYGEGEDAVVKAIENAIHSEIVDMENVKNSSTVIFNITCAPRTIKVQDADNATNLIHSYIENDKMDHLFFGYSFDASLGDRVKVTFIATGTKQKEINSEASVGKSGSNVESFTFAPTPTQEKKATFVESEQEEKEESKVIKPNFFK